jgi:cytochrome c oxidase subunit 3
MDATISATIPQRKIISNGMIAMVFFIAAEAMFFAGLISAYIVNRSVADAMPVIQQPRLPIEITAINSLILILSFVTLFLFSKKYKTESKSFFLLYITIIFGAVFIGVQGIEWVNLLHFGFSTSSSIYGAFFYTIIGAHAVHVIAGLIILLYLSLSLKKDKSLESVKNKIAICSLYWYFVVSVWPILYVLVYLT